MAMDLARSVILDTETFGLKRGAGLHSAAVYSFETNRTHEYHLAPNVVNIAQGPQNQDWTQLSAGWRDKHYLAEAKSWSPQIRKARATGGSFFQEHLPRYTWLEGNYTEAQTQARQTMIGSPLTTSRTTAGEFLAPGGALERELQGKTVWIANANFESKQIGALLGGLEAQGRPTTALKRTMQTFSESPDPFYVTGKEVQTARTLAQRDGDWSRVWRAYQTNLPGPGETAVRDIQDVLKAIQSFGQKQGLLRGSGASFTTAIDDQFRYMGGVGPELHMAAEDVAIHEKTVLTRGVGWATVLQHVQDSTPEGLEHLRQAKQGQGALWDIGQYFRRLEGDDFEKKRINLLQRFERAQQDLAGPTKSHWMTAGWQDIYMRTQETPGGTILEIPQNQAQKVRFGSMDHVVDFLARDASYIEAGLDPRTEYTRLQETIGQMKGGVAENIGNTLDELKKGFRTRTSAADLKSAVPIDFGKILTKDAMGAGWRGKAALGMAAFVGIGVWWGTDHGRDRYESKNYTGYGYDEFLARSTEFSGSQPYHAGMQESGIAGSHRRMNTDFGSPYQGMVASQTVFEDQELSRERERYMRGQFSRQIQDPEFGLFGLDSPFRGMNIRGRGGYRFQAGGTAVDSKNFGLRGNLLQLDMAGGDWEMTAEDADTVVVKQGGIRGAIKSFFGLNQGASFRLAGIDSPETFHGSKSYHAPQPGAEESKRALQQMLEDKNTKLLYDPKQTTYGRSMGVLFQGNQNLNYELVRRGHAAYLPFGNPRDSMIGYNSLKAMEISASGAGRGIWSQPWTQAYRDIMEVGGDRVTFNTFTKASRVAQSQSLMTTLGVMESAQAQGGMTDTQRAETVMLGQNVAARDTKGDYRSRAHFTRESTPQSTIAPELQRDMKTFMETKGQGAARNQFSIKSGYGKLDQSMVLDSLQTTNQVWQHPSMQASGLYGAREQLRLDRRQRQAALQRSLNQTVFASGINHQQQ